MSMPDLTLNTGAKIPALGFGTWQIDDGQETVEAVTAALDRGYRLIDTAKLYGNESGVGMAIRESSVPREEVFLTTKLWNTDHGYEQALKAFDGSLERLGLSYIDLYLIHWPASQKLAETWEALCELKRQGVAKAIGVANYSVMHLQELLTNSSVPPAVNQIEFNPYVYADVKPIVDFCRRHGIVVMAYSPLGHGRVEDKAIAAIAESHGKTPAQVMLRWAVQHGTVPIPKSAHLARIKENFDIFDFKLTDDEMAKINGL